MAFVLRQAISLSMGCMFLQIGSARRPSGRARHDALVLVVDFAVQFRGGLGCVFNLDFLFLVIGRQISRVVDF
jgi:hypothetical protein